MSSLSGQPDDESARLERHHPHDPQSLAGLRLRCHGPLVNMLLARGANHTEAEDLLADLWADCVPGMDDRPSLLDKFSGRCDVQTWLATVLTRRWIDLKRRQARHPELSRSEAEMPDEDVLEGVAEAASPHEPSLVDLLRESLRAGFAACPPEAMVALRLVYVHGLTQRELVRMLGWHESKVSRLLAQAMKQIERVTLRTLRTRDPWLQLTWQDFVDLCETQQIGFL